MRSRTLMGMLLGLGLCPPVAAQTRPAPPNPIVFERVFIAIDGIYQVGSNDFGDSMTIRENAENGRLETDYTVGAGPAFGVTGGALITRNVAVGVGVSRFSTSTVTEVNASVPHPFFFSQPRTVSGEFGGTRTELAVHLQLRGVFPVSDRVQVALFGGPSFFQVDQSIVSDFDYTETYPYDAATFSRAVAADQSASKVGFNAGGDVAFFFSPGVGVGVTAQYAGATVQMPLLAGDGDVKAGGLKVGGGLRLRF